MRNDRNMLRVWITTALIVLCNHCFQSQAFTFHQQWRVEHRVTLTLPSSKFGDDTFLLSGFKTASGEIINPYKVLKISRKATRDQVRQAYIGLSRRYHPDGARNRDLLPGSCNNLDDVRDQWERIKLSYEILSDKKMRMKYDREEALSDPGAAIKRAAVTAAVDGFVGLGKGIFDAGAFAVGKLVAKE
jgi:DnaJ-class molecular chaperone